MSEERHVKHRPHKAVNTKPDNYAVIDSDTSKQSPIDTGKPQKKKFVWTRKRIIIAVVSALVVLGGATGGYLWWRNATKRTVTSRTVESPKTTAAVAKPNTKPSMLTGVEVEPSLATRPTLATVIENLYPDARPQSGLSTAGVVYEALAEGGITRYLALYQEKLPDNIGPIRSIRTYFVDWGLEYDAPVVHAGGNIDALDLIDPLGMKNLDQFYNGNYFRRIGTRYAPHNLYSTGKQLDQLMKDRGYFETPKFEPWQRKDDTKSSSPNGKAININFSYSDYDAQFEYDPASNSYLRSVRNQPDIDADNNKRITPKNVVVMYMPTSYGLTRINEQTVIMQTIGSGRAIVFEDGIAIDGTWSKSSHDGRTIFRDSTGKVIQLNRGQTWVSVIPTTKSVSYQ